MAIATDQPTRIGVWDVILRATAAAFIPLATGPAVAADCRNSRLPIQEGFESIAG